MENQINPLSSQVEKILSKLKQGKEDFVNYYGKDAEKVMVDKAIKISNKMNKKNIEELVKETIKSTLTKHKTTLDEAYVPDNIKKFAKRKGVSSLVNKVAGWAEKVGKKITDGTAIGKNYDTLILDMGYQTSDIYINTGDETIELYGEEVNSFPEFKKVYDEYVKGGMMKEGGSDLAERQLGIKELLYNPNEIHGKYDIGDIVKYKGKDHEVTRVEIDRIYIRPTGTSMLGKPSHFWVKYEDLQEKKSTPNFAKELAEKLAENKKGWNSKNDTPEIKALMAVADNTSNSPLERDEARQKAYDLRIQMNLKEDIDIGHEDDEPNMIKADLYQLRKDINDLCSMVEKYDNMNTEIDFPAWWQEKITTSKAMILGAKEYLDFESNDTSLEEKKLTKAEKNKKEKIVKGMKGNFKGSEAAMYAIATDKAKKLAEAIAKRLKESYMISKSGPKSNPYFVLEKTDGTEQIDMMFSSPEEAKTYAKKKNLKLSLKSGYNMNETKEGDIDWKKMGFKSEAEYKAFMDKKAKDLMDKIKNDPKLLNVFKRLNDK